ncbi:MAG: hypothetical protein RL226_2020 [Bacteroidota bacterium]
MIPLLTHILIVAQICWSTPASSFVVDDLGYVYTLHEYSVIKHALNGDTMFVYSRMDLGSVSELDVSNPLRPLVFHKETASIAILDNTLSEQGVISVWNVLQGQPGSVASGVNQDIWIYDEINQELFRLDERLNISVSSGFIPGITGRHIQLIGIAERHEQLWLADANYGIWIFDRFGTLVHRIPVQDLRSMRAHAEAVILTTSHGVFEVNYSSRALDHLSDSSGEMDYVGDKWFSYEQNRICIDTR